MSPDDLDHCPSHRHNIELAGQPEVARSVVDDTPRIELLEDPEPLLRK